MMSCLSNLLLSVLKVVPGTLSVEQLEDVVYVFQMHFQKLNLKPLGFESCTYDLASLLFVAK